MARIPEQLAKTPELRLLCNGLSFGGWTEISVTRGIEAAAGAFSLGVTDRWTGQEKPWPIHEEDECSVEIGGEPITTGFVDKRRLAFDANSHSLSVEGRDRAGAIVDCSAEPPYEYKQISPLKLAQKLAEPFGIDVSLQAGLKEPEPIDKFSIDPGDKVFDAIAKACRLAGLLPVSDGYSGLVLTRAGATRAVTDLVEGQNIKAASGDYDCTERFRTYRVLGQSQGRKNRHGKSAASVKAEATDETVLRSERLHVVRPDANVTTAQAKQRAQWEATVRAAKGYDVSITVQGWQQGDGSLWPINALVHLKSPYLEIDSDMLIVATTFGLDCGSGSTTQLKLARPDAYLPKPIIKPKKGAKSGRWDALRGGVNPSTAGIPNPWEREVSIPVEDDPTGQSVWIPPEAR